MQGIRDLTSGSIGSRLFNLAMPIMGTSFIQMAYNLVDMAWIGRLGSEAVAAVGAVGILVWMTSSAAMLSKVGAEVSVGQSIGARNMDDARLFASHNATIGLILSAVLGSAMYILAPYIIGFYKLEPSITSEAVGFLRILTAGFPFVFLTYTFTGIHNAAGRSRIPFFVNGAGLLLNMSLDPLFIFVFGWGTAGAAFATCISQGAVCLLFVYHLRRRSRLLGGFPFLVRLERRYAGRIFRLGLPVAILNMLFALINFCMGRTASLRGGHIGLMTLTAGGQIEALSWNTSQGFSTALSAFIAQNYASGRNDRVKGAYRATLRMTSVLGVFCTFLFFFYGREIFALLVPEREAYLSGGVFLKIEAYSMLFMMLEITAQGFFYGVGRTTAPAVISIGFNLVRIPLAVILSATSLGMTGIWWAISLTSIAKGVTAFIWLKLLRRKVMSRTYEGDMRS
ncbi:MAG: MATE family efflux transporter [Tannerellaceae bacterium]|jgi:putative MATE family efflux protein|nr:MATE family efflux transporter [Tannerellaceae bacterium]